jgi:hypothetical protein
MTGMTASPISPVTRAHAHTLEKGQPVIPVISGAFRAAVIVLKHDASHTPDRITEKGSHR